MIDSDFVLNNAMVKLAELSMQIIITGDCEGTNKEEKKERKSKKHLFQ